MDLNIPFLSLIPYEEIIPLRDFLFKGDFWKTHQRSSISQQALANKSHFEIESLPCLVSVLERMFYMQRVFNVAFNLIGAFPCVRGASFLGVPTPVQLGAHLVTGCSRAVLMAPYSSEARGVRHVFYKEMFTFSVGLISMFAFTLILGPTGRITPVLINYSIPISYAACATLLALMQMVSDLFAFQIVHRVIPHLCHRAGYHESQKDLSNKNRGEIERLKGELTTNKGELEGKLNLIQVQLAEKEGELERLKGELTTNKGELERLNVKLTEKEGELERLNLVQAQLTTKNEELEGKLSLIQEQIAEKEEELKQLKEELSAPNMQELNHSGKKKIEKAHNENIYRLRQKFELLKKQFLDREVEDSKFGSKNESQLDTTDGDSSFSTNDSNGQYKTQLKTLLEESINMFIEELRKIIESECHWNRILMSVDHCESVFSKCTEKKTIEVKDKTKEGLHTKMAVLLRHSSSDGCLPVKEKQPPGETKGQWGSLRDLSSVLSEDFNLL